MTEITAQPIPCNACRESQIHFYDLPLQQDCKVHWCHYFTEKLGSLKTMELLQNFTFHHSQL